MQLWFSICKSINMVYHIKKANEKNHTIISTDPKDAFDKIQHAFDKSFNELSIKGRCINIIKVIYNKSTTNIILNGEKLKSFPLRPGIRQKCLYSLLLFTTVLQC